MQVLQPDFLKMPPIVCGVDDAAVHQHLQQRFHAVRIARGLAGQQRLQLRRRFGHALQKGLGQRVAQRSAVRLQVCDGVLQGLLGILGRGHVKWSYRRCD